ncbi:hypothetical protein [Enterococcus sp. BWR-S5]|uniref:hypothetical protein n=1 Tax=Enterococcus sp. BWR-S5 TaxID=2787714 RepID=UPI00192090FD|nr:hypothetical protein [Enterococcus sp. BWR-S5]MBL1225240.1 hypothetical protein [Enterococcus sp. BWR-S5]
MSAEKYYLLLNSESFYCDEKPLSTEAIKELSQLTETEEFKYDLGYQLAYDSEQFWQMEINESGCLSDVLDYDEVNILYLILSNAASIDNEKKKLMDCLDLCGTRGYYGLLSLGHDLKWQVAVLEDVKNIYDEESSKTHSLEYRQMLLKDRLYDKELFTTKLAVTSTSCPVKNIHFHDQFFSEFNKVSSEVQKFALQKLFFVIGGTDLDELSDRTYHSDDNIKDDKDKSNERKVYFSKVPKKIYRHHKSGGYSFYMEKEGKDVYVGKLTKHLSTKKYKKR